MDKNKIVKSVTIVLAYIVFFGLFGVIEKVLNGSTVGFVIFMVISCAFAYKSLKGALSDALSFLPLPVYVVIVLILSGTIGCLVAPYHIGKWIADQVNDFI